MNPSEETDSEAEDQLYLSYICTLVLIDRESEAAIPDFPRIQYLRAKADADRAELECSALRLSLMSREDVECLKDQLLHVAEKELDTVEISAMDSLDENAQSHPRIAARNLKMNLEKVCGGVATTVEAAGNNLLRDPRVKSARARRLKELLEEATIADYKREISAQLQATGEEPSP